jgi:hypothetical protein
MRETDNDKTFLEEQLRHLFPSELPTSPISHLSHAIVCQLLYVVHDRLKHEIASSSISFPTLTSPVIVIDNIQGRLTDLDPLPRRLHRRR